MDCRPAGMSEDESEDEFGVPIKTPAIVPVQGDDAREDFGEASTPLIGQEKPKSLSKAEYICQIEYRISHACKTGDLEYVKEYLKHHNVNEFLTTGWSLLFYAAEAAEADMIKYLLEQGADPNKYKGGFSPLMALCLATTKSKEQLIECLKHLLNSGADVNAYNEYRETALTFACQTQTAEFVKELLNFVKDINNRDTSGMTALMYAVAHNKPEVVSLLLEYGADKTVQDSQGYNCTDIATHLNNKKILNVLDPTSENTTEEYAEYAVPPWDKTISSLTVISGNEIDYDVFGMLTGMEMVCYRKCFMGVALKKFLQLTADELTTLGVDLSAYRRRFMSDLHRFHSRRWMSQSVGDIPKTLNSPYTPFDATIRMATVGKHVTVIGTGFSYMTSSWMDYIKEQNAVPDEETTADCLVYLENLKGSVKNLRTELTKLKSVAKQIHKKQNIRLPPCYIGFRERKLFSWPNVLKILIVAMTVSILTKAELVKRL